MFDEVIDRELLIREVTSLRKGRPLELLPCMRLQKIRISLQTKMCLHIEKIIINGENTEGKVISSSVYQDNDRYSPENVLKDKGIFHSKTEDMPWLEVQFESPLLIESLVISNAIDNLSKRMNSIQVVGVDVDGVNVVLFDNWHLKKAMVQDIKMKRIANGESVLDCNLKLAKVYAAAHDVHSLKKLIEPFVKKDSTIAQALIESANVVLNKHELGYTHHGIYKVFGAMTGNRKRSIVNELCTVMDSILHEANIATFLTSGTLLGIFRDGDLIDHDDDLDICYLSNKNTEKDVLEERLAFVKYLNTKGLQAKIIDQGHIQARLNNTGVTLDLFVAFINDGKICCSPLPRGEMDVSDVLPLKNLYYKGVELCIPRNPSKYLSINYGPSWNKEDKTWRFNWERAFLEYGFLRGQR